MNLEGIWLRLQVEEALSGLRLSPRSYLDPLAVRRMVRRHRLTMAHAVDIFNTVGRRSPMTVAEFARQLPLSPECPILDVLAFVLLRRLDYQDDDVVIEAILSRLPEVAPGTKLSNTYKPIWDTVFYWMARLRPVNSEHVRIVSHHCVRLESPRNARKFLSLALESFCAESVGLPSIRVLVEHGADVRFHKSQALVYATSSRVTNHSDVIAFLVEKGAGPIPIRIDRREELRETLKRLTAHEDEEHPTNAEIRRQMDTIKNAIQDMCVEWEYMTEETAQFVRRKLAMRRRMPFVMWRAACRVARTAPS